MRDGDDYVINGRKWWTSGASDPRCKILIVMGRTNPDAASHQQQSMVLVPIDTPGRDRRPLDAGLRLAGPARALRDHLRQRAGAGRPTCSARRATASRSPRPGWARAASTTACARSACAERALALMVRPGPAPGSRSAGRWPSRAWCSRRLPSPATRSTRPGCCARRRRGRSTSTATRPPTSWSRRSRSVAPQVACDVIDRAIQVHGAAGVSDDTALARTVRLAPGHADLRRPRRGAHAIHRARRDWPREVRTRGGGHAHD